MMKTAINNQIYFMENVSTWIYDFKNDDSPAVRDVAKKQLKMFIKWCETTNSVYDMIYEKYLEAKKVLEIHEN